MNRGLLHVSEECGVPRQWSVASVHREVVRRVGRGGHRYSTLFSSFFSISCTRNADQTFSHHFSLALHLLVSFHERISPLSFSGLIASLEWPISPSRRPTSRSSLLQPTEVKASSAGIALLLLDHLRDARLAQPSSVDAQHHWWPRSDGL